MKDKDVPSHPSPSPSRLIFDYCLRRPFHSTALFALSVSLGLLALAELNLLARFADAVILEGGRATLWKFAALYLLFAACIEAGRFAYTLLLRRLCLDFGNSLRSSLFDKLQQLSPVDHATRSSGDLFNQMRAETTALEAGVSIFGNAVRESALVACLAWAAFQQDWKGTAAAMVFLPPAAYWIHRRSAGLPAIWAAIQGANARMNALLLESSRCARIVRVFQAETEELRRFESHQAGARQDAFRSISLVSKNILLFAMVSFVATGALFALSGDRVLSGEIPPGGFLSFVIGVSAIFHPMSGLFDARTFLQQLRGTASRLLETLESAPSVRDDGRLELDGEVQEVEFDRVAFRYPGSERLVFSDVSFRARKGDVVAVLGHNGSGKSTLLNLLPRFFEPAEGVVRVNSRPLSDWTLRSLRSRIALVSQDTVLFDDTIAANIAYGAPGASRQDVERAARAAHAAEFIERMPKGYDSPVGERGGLLSEGQKQRVAIARAFLKDAPILLLDEPTSALDSASKEAIQSALASLMRNRIVFIVTHHPDELPADAKILRLDGGSLLERNIADGEVSRPRLRAN